MTSVRRCTGPRSSDRATRVMRRMLIAVIVCTAACAAAAAHGIATAPEAEGNLGKFDKVWQDFDAHYAYFDIGHIDWHALGAKYHPLASAATNDRELASAIGAMIGELRDYHADLVTPFGTFVIPARAASSAARH